MSYLLTPRHPSQASLIRSFGISCDLMARVYWSRTINITFQTFVRVLYEEWTHKQINLTSKNPPYLILQSADLNLNFFQITFILHQLIMVRLFLDLGIFVKELEIIFRIN